ncbi:MAG: hypothetical protein ACHP7N_03725 [Caulobacterales bacterium]
MRSWAMLALLVIGACAAPPAKAPPPAPAPAPVIAPPPPAPVAQAAPKDACGAVDLQYLVGRSRTEIPVPVEPSRRRVSCTTCPITQDYVPYRQTILYDAETGLVTSVKCG